MPESAVAAIASFIWHRQEKTPVEGHWRDGLVGGGGERHVQERGKGGRMVNNGGARGEAGTGKGSHRKRLVVKDAPGGAQGTPAVWQGRWRQEVTPSSKGRRHARVSEGRSWCLGHGGWSGNNELFCSVKKALFV